MDNFSVYLTRTFRLNYSVFPNSCFLSQFTIIINSFYMFINCWNTYIIKYCHHFLC
ncbi:Uncharacterised protein [Hungatella hathewayi]|uniref:Uncharacterized protein n=1 Tax=Hungatella hathewayi TaxID=154046 RepID=A0A174J6N9_9FIRM|nr:Uncharacterised protein [Hungatella hathewayi]